MGDLYNGKINYPISSLSADIFIEEDGVDIAGFEKYDVSDFEILPGKGLCARVNSDYIRGGNLKYIEKFVDRKVNTENNSVEEIAEIIRITYPVLLMSKANK